MRNPRRCRRNTAFRSRSPASPGTRRCFLRRTFATRQRRHIAESRCKSAPPRTFRSSLRTPDLCRIRGRRSSAHIHSCQMSRFLGSCTNRSFRRTQGLFRTRGHRSWARSCSCPRRRRSRAQCMCHTKSRTRGRGRSFGPRSRGCSRTCRCEGRRACRRRIVRSSRHTRDQRRRRDPCSPLRKGRRRCPHRCRRPRRCPRGEWARGCTHARDGTTLRLGRRRDRCRRDRLRRCTRRCCIPKRAGSPTRWCIRPHTQARRGGSLGRRIVLRGRLRRPGRRCSVGRRRLCSLG